jgi:hypothetical protein
MRTRCQGGVVVGLEQVVGAESRLDAAGEGDETLPLGRDHLVQEIFDLVRLV